MISSLLLQEHRRRNEEVSCKKIIHLKRFMLLFCLYHYSSKMYHASFMLTPDSAEELNKDYDDMSCMTRDTGTYGTSFGHAVD